MQKKIKDFEEKKKKELLGKKVDKEHLLNKTVVFEDWDILKSNIGKADANYVAAQIQCDGEQCLVLLPHVIAEHLSQNEPPLRAKIIKVKSKNGREYWDLAKPE